MILNTLVKLSQQDYVKALMLQTDKSKRMKMKQLAHGVMYGSNPDAGVLMPYNLLPQEYKEQVK